MAKDNVKQKNLLCLKRYEFTCAIHLTYVCHRSFTSTNNRHAGQEINIYTYLESKDRKARQEKECLKPYIVEVKK